MKRESRFPRLLERGQIGSMALKNRIKAAGTTTLFSTPEGLVTERDINFFAERARGGTALVAAGGAYVHPTGRTVACQMSICDDSAIPGLARLAKAIKGEGARASFNLLHYGRYASPVEGVPVGPSVVPPRLPHFQTVRELRRDEIREIIDSFALAAGRAIKAGFECIELLASMGTLISSFFSPWTNRRQDEYGGSLEKRARFFLEVIDAVRGVVGKQCPIIARISANDLMAESSTPEELLRYGQMAEEAGIDAVSLMVGWHESSTPFLTMEVPPGSWLYLAEEWKKYLKIPIMSSWRLNSPYLAERAMEEGKIDFWELCRPLIADPQIANKLAEGRPEDIVPCTACCQGCAQRLWAEELPIRCLINPRVGREGERGYQVRPASVKKKVLVVGGGPAGMEAAIVAAQRGHEVMLCDDSEALGGQLKLAARAPTRGEIADIISYLTTQLRKQRVKVELRKKVTPELVEEIRPRVVVIATGSSPMVPEIEGAGEANVVMADDVLAEKVPVGRDVVVLGGGLTGLEAAEFLAGQGKKVTVVEVLGRVARDAVAPDRWGLMHRLSRLGVIILVNTRLSRVTAGSAIIVNAKGEEQALPADTLVLAVGRRPNKDLWEALESRVDELYVVGDTLRPRKALDAIHEGFRAGIQI